MEYGERNLQVHMDLYEFIREGKFLLLAKTLHSDQRELDATFSRFKSATDIKFLKSIIQFQIDEWFDSNINPDKPEVWNHTAVLQRIYKDAWDKATKPTKQDLEQANRAMAQKLFEDNAAREEDSCKAGSSVKDC